MSNMIEVRGVKIGEGASKIIVPIVESEGAAIPTKAKTFADKKIDLCEWRADFFNECDDHEAVKAVLKELRAALHNMPILFTFRTKKEGGEREISMERYTALNKMVAESGYVDLVDVEIFSGDEIVAENIKNIQAAKVQVIASNHDFHQTPSEQELVSRMLKMQDMGADILKIAMMPQCMQDVITLLSATNTMVSQHAKKPVITMSMSAKGSLSRIVGEAFGSSVTFGSLGKVSAPGQIPVEDLKTSIDILHSAIA